MDRRPEHSEEKLKPTLSIGGEKQSADSSGWAPKRRGAGVYRLKELNRSRKKRRGEIIQFENEDDGKRKSPRTFLILGVLSLIALVVASYWFFAKRASMRAASAQQETLTSRVLEVAQDEVVSVSAEDWKGELPLQIATAFVQATTTAERLRHVRNPESNARILADFFEQGPGAREKLSALVPIRSIHTDEMAAEEFRADFEGGGSRVVCVVLENDSAKVDFKCYSGHASVDFAKLLDGSTVRADQVRLIVNSSEPYYNFTFADDSQWTSFIGQNPDLPMDLLLYARTGSDAERDIKESTKSGPSLMTLSLESREESHKHRQFEVSSVLARSWVEPPAARKENAD